MKVTLESTDRVVEIEFGGKAIPGRLWEGKTDAGVAVQAFIIRISPQTHDPAALAVFERELALTRTPTFEPFNRPIDLRLIL